MIGDRRLPLFFTVMLIACERAPESDDWEPDPHDTDTGDTDTWDPPEEPFDAAAGFINLPPRPVAYTYGGRISGTTDEANIFYTLVPADERPEEMPLLVMLSGGPGAATTGYLLPYGTAPYFIDRSDPALPVKPNPDSFSAIGNVLYIDTRQAGFSYELAPTPGTARMEFASNDIFDSNAFTDVSDILLTVLGVMETAPALRNNPVVLVGESYGGARLTHIYSLLDRPADLLDPDAPYFFDPILGEALKGHFAAVMPEVPFEVMTLVDAAEQFGWQIMLQPADMLPFRDQYTGCRCLGIMEGDPRFELCRWNDHDWYDLREPWQEPDELGLAAANVFLHPPTFELLFGVPPASIPGLSAADRQRAFRDIPFHRLAAPSDEWKQQLGVLGGKDYYYIPLIDGSQQGMDFVLTTTTFMRSLAYVDTFISNAFYDYMVSTDRLPGVIMDANGILPAPLVESVTLDAAAPAGVERPGEMRVVFTGAMGLGQGATATVRMPAYLDAGHIIPLHQAGDLREDIRAFLEERGAYP